MSRHEIEFSVLFGEQTWQHGLADATDEVEELRQARNGGVGLNAAPIATTATTKCWHLVQTVTEKMQLVGRDL